MKVIIDNMMNLELFFIGEALTGNHVYRQHAISHADKTMQNHVRADGVSYFSFSFRNMESLIYIERLTGSSFHLVKYNETTGAVIFQGTAQGYADSR